jgi:hypothetical protein
LGLHTFAQDAKLAVINTQGEVWARDLSSNDVGPGVKLTGPNLFGGPDEQFVVASLNSIAVITKSGMFWPRIVDNTAISAASRLSGSLFGGSDTKYVLDGRSCSAVYVVNNRGEVWAHSIGPSAVGIGSKLKGPSLFGSTNDKYVVYDDSNKRILVINTRGEVWAHDISSSTPNIFCGLDTIGTGYKLDGPGLFDAPNDKYVICIGSRLLVINTLGEVWAREISRSAISRGVKLNGPKLFGAPDDKYVVAYYVRLSSPPPR